MARDGRPAQKDLDQLPLQIWTADGGFGRFAGFELFIAAPSRSTLRPETVSLQPAPR